VAALPLPEQQAGWRRIVGAEQLETQGRFEEALRAAGGQPPASWTVLRACKTISWANMKEQRSEALLLFHALTCKKCQESSEVVDRLAGGRADD
jgi:hypothetical protein